MVSICPGFWEWIDQRHAEQKVSSVSKVREEIGNGTDELVAWANARPEFFAAPDSRTQAEFRAVTEWAASQNYTPRAVSEFLQKADFFLIAHARTLDLVTLERREQTTGKIKIPNACDALGVRVMDPFKMLREEGAKFVLA